LPDRRRWAAGLREWQSFGAHSDAALCSAFGARLMSFLPLFLPPFLALSAHLAFHASAVKHPAAAGGRRRDSGDLTVVAACCLAVRRAAICQIDNS